MSSDDPFASFDSDRTILRPVSQPDPVRSEDAAKASELPLLGGINTIEHCASRLLGILAHVNSTSSHPDTAYLKKTLSDEIQIFSRECSVAGISPDTISTASYVLCTALDEAVLNTPWGHTSGWSNQSLLSTFHQDVAGGEKFFQILKSLSEDPVKHYDILELMYLCLSMGFKGRYRIVADGENKISRVREWLYNLLASSKSKPELALSDHWQGEIQSAEASRRTTPLWIKLTFIAAVLGILAVIYTFNLSTHSDKYVASASEIIFYPLETSVTPEKTEEPKEELVSLRKLLQHEIESRQLAVIENSRFSQITIAGDGMFRAGKDTINEKVRTLLVNIGEALDLTGGRIKVTGHSDSIPIRTARFPSNWELSQARADAVAAILKSVLRVPDRVTSEGQSSLQPVASNETAAGRAKNRRVEILLVR